MNKLNRRQFLSAGAAGSVGLMAAGSSAALAGEAISKSAAVAAKAKPFDEPIYFQSYGMRREIEKDFTGTLKTVKDLGFDGVEMCSPHGNYYRTAGYGNLTDLPASEVRKMIADTGLACESSHFEAHEVLVDDLDETIEYAAGLGLEAIIMSGSTFGDDGTVDEIKEWGEKCNRAGERVKAAGLKLGYHNHLVGPMVDGKPQFDHIMDALDPDLVVNQFQIMSITGGYDPAYYLDKYAGRYIALHMADYDPAAKGRRPGRLGATVPLGQGIVDWPEVLHAAMESPIADYGYIIEMETQSGLEDLRKSIAYLRSMQV